jgi:RND family efflux transporter MFP subunit
MAILRRVKSALRWVVPVAIIIIMMLWLTGWFRKDSIGGDKLQTETRPVSGVGAYTVSLVRMPAVSEAVGTIQPQHKTTVSSRVSANVVEMRVQAGQIVQKDDLLARLDDRDLRARVNQAKESLSHAEATKELASSDYRRDKPLLEKGAISPSEFDQTDARLKTAASDVQHALDALREAEVALSYADLRSPITGVVIDKLADVGDLAVPGKALITMYQPDHLWLEASVREQEAPRLQIGATYTVNMEATGAKMEGKLAEIVPSSDPASRIVTARIAIPRTEGLYPGMFGRLSIPLEETGVLLVPEASVTRIGQLNVVDVIDGDTLKRRSVQIGSRQGGKLEVLSGLAEGERVALPPVKGTVNETER